MQRTAGFRFCIRHFAFRIPSYFLCPVATMLGLLAASALSAQTITPHPQSLAQREKGKGSGLPQLSPVFREGTHVFRRLLYDARLQPIHEAELGNDPQNTILIVLGDAQEVLARINRSPQFAAAGPRQARGLHRFVQEGGAVLIATDRPTTVELGRSLQVFVNGALVEVPPQRGYRGLAECPFLKPLSTDFPSPFEGLNRIATNNSSYLSVKVAAWRGPLTQPSFQLHELAVLEDSCRLKPQSETSREAKPDRFLFAVGGNLGKGSLLVLADHSVFINDMLLQPDLLYPDNDNMLLARNCIALLKGPMSRSKVLLLENSLAHRQLNMPLSAPVLPPYGQRYIDMLWHHINHDQMLDKLFLSSVPVERLKPFLFLIMTLLLLIATLVGIERLRYRQEARVPFLAFDKPMSQESMTQKRSRALLYHGNFWEPARALAREFFENASLVPLCEGQVKNEAAVPFRARPKVKAESGLWERWAYSRSIKRFWWLATSSTPTRVSRRQFAQLLAELQILKRAISEGHVRIDL